jgi:hypothetical protein
MNIAILSSSEIYELRNNFGNFASSCFVASRPGIFMVESIMSIKCVSILSKIFFFFWKMFRSGKYLASYARRPCRNVYGLM